MGNLLENLSTLAENTIKLTERTEFKVRLMSL